MDLVHLGRGTLQVVWALVLLCVTPFDAPSLAMVCGLEEVDHLPSLFSPLFHPLLILINYNGVWIERDQNCFLSPLVALFDSRQSP